jgi:hypothetical protein
MRGRVVVICAAPILRDTRIGVNQGILQILNALPLLIFSFLPMAA